MAVLYSVFQFQAVSENYLKVFKDPFLCTFTFVYSGQRCQLSLEAKMDKKISKGGLKPRKISKRGLKENFMGLFWPKITALVN